MNTLPAGLITPNVPHLLAQVPPGVPAEYLYLGEEAWRLTDDRALAFVFPGFLLAARYAAQCARLINPIVLMPVADPIRALTLPADGHAACRVCGCTDTFACPDRCGWGAEPFVCSTCERGGTPYIWALYDRPSDYPEGALARLYAGAVPTEAVFRAPTVQGLRDLLPEGLERLERFAGDQKSLVDVLW